MNISVMPSLMSLDEMPVYLMEEMHESIRSAVSFGLVFDGEVVTWG
ncbi:MAG: hypothetical protein FWG45_06985 [Oscillospiraceae bacterium]|nr:hypothetical protein [Oscillospiraceae bacterium]